MKVKELDLTANVAWSPASLNPVYLATGTAAQQLDATFSTNSALELYRLNLDETGYDMPKVASLPVESRYHKLAWAAPNLSDPNRASGVIVGGLDQGVLTMYDAHKLLKGQDNPVLFSQNKHTGPVSALDFNPFQSNLLASGASESEIFIWDLNKLTAPMTPGGKSQPADDVRCVAWNKQVQHILASSFASRCVVWDLRKNDPIIKVSDSTSRMRSKVVAWHPEVATQLCLASEDDHTPVIQIWDLRLASSPLRTLESHQRGVLSVAWCDQDSDLLLSCGKDNRILCWNPNSSQPGGEVLCELASSTQWSFEVSWCPRNPAVIASSSFDGHVAVYSLMGGQQQAQPTMAIADSFPGMEAMQPVAQQPSVTMQLKKPPKWLMKPCAARFGFGGRLVSVETVKAPANSQQPSPPKSSVYLSKVITEQELVDRSMRLETSIQSQNLAEFCESKIQTTVRNEDQQIWRFIKANFQANPRLEFLDLLGYNPDQIASLVEEISGVKLEDPQEEHEMTNGLTNLDSTIDKEGAFEAIAAKAVELKDVSKPANMFKIATDESPTGLLTKALLAGNIELAVELCLEQNRMADALVLATQGGEELVQKIQKKYFAKCQSQESNLIRGVVTGDWHDFVERCDPSGWKEALVAIVTYASNEEFPLICTNLGSRLSGLPAMLCFICAGDLDKVVECWMKTKTTDDGPNALQDLVEVVMTLKNAIEQIYGQVNISSGPLSAKLIQYANLLAAQGALSAALGYLGDSEEDSIRTLRDRLSGALGRQATTSSMSKTYQQKTHRSSVSARSRQSSFGYDSAPPQPTFAPTPAPPPSTGPMGMYPTSQPSYGGFGSSLDYSHPSSSAVPSWNTQVSAPSPMVPSNVPAAPPSIFNPASAVPSSMAPPVADGPPLPMGHIPDHGGPGYKPPVSDGFGWNDPPPMSLTSKPKASSLTTKTTTSLSSEPITQPLMGAPPSEVPPTNHANQYGIMNPANTGMAGPPLPSPANSMMSGGQGMYGASPYGSTPTPGGFVNPAPLPPSSQASYGFNPNPDQGTAYSTPANFMIPAQPDLPANMMTPAQFQPSPPSGSSSVMQREPAPPKEKGPIPPEHQEIHDVFENLRTKCLASANHPQTRRKLEDVGKKLEILYNKLREQSLPVATTSGLHQIVRCICSYDYQSCLVTVNKLVSTGSFTTLSEFLPGVKVLLQVATQLGVFPDPR